MCVLYSIQALILILLMTLEGPVYMLQLLEGEYRNSVFDMNCKCLNGVHGLAIKTVS